MLLALGSHPHASVSGKGRFFAGVKLGGSNKNAFSGLTQEIFKRKTVSHVLLGYLVGQANVGANQLCEALLVIRVLELLNESELLVFGKNDCSGCE